MSLPDVSAVAALIEGQVVRGVGDLAGERLLRFGAEIGGNRNDAGDVRGSIGIDVTGIGVGSLGGGGALLGESGGGDEQKSGDQQLHEVYPGGSGSRGRITDGR